MAEHVVPDAVALAGALLLAGCSTSFGGAGTYAVQPSNYASVGFQSRSLLEAPLVWGENTHLTAGLETAVLTRPHSHDDWGQWRLRPLIGLARMPRTYQYFVGWEAFLVPGVARYYAHDRPLVAFAPGLDFGLPIRLSPGRPPWQSDDLVAINGYLVPALGVTSLGACLPNREQLELTAGLSLRLQLWSAMVP